MVGEGIEHHVPPRAVDLDQAVDVLAPGALGEVLAHEVLGQRRSAEVGGLLAQPDLLQDGRRRGDPADPYPRGEDLGKGAEIEDVVPSVERVERPLRLAVVAQQAVGVVLDDQHLVHAGES